MKTLTIIFDMPLRHSELSQFRGAIVAAIPSSNILFHNHNGTTLRYAYPLIQYKRIEGKAAIVCIGEGVEAISEFLTRADFNIMLGTRKVALRIERIDAEEVDIGEALPPITYCLNNWLALNENNYRKFQAIDSIAERIQMLERILAGNILSMLKGLNIRIDFRLQPIITDYTANRTAIYKGVRLTSLNITFKANILLPEYIGLGKHSSMGTGVLTKKKPNNQ
ncbi:CRISPR-associated endonuclease Cas6 [Prevotella falsenii]|uniref:CRISPR-associated endonuclease Cas6 n=1 Tax=Prevotella falsenii TaxID=515414 RepID=UPI00046A6A1A|nr:CRISPR-associated endonuclease Cas6 [Prevotella falsenii]